MPPLLLLILEILLITATFVVYILGYFPLPILTLIPIAWASLLFRRLKWRDVGLRQPGNWLTTIGLALLVGIGYQALDIFAIGPLLQSLTGQPIDLSQFKPIQGNLFLLITSLAVTWVLAALPEEMFFRGYLFTRLEGLFGGQKSGLILALIGSSFIFGIAHSYQNFTGVLDTFLAGVVLCLLYLSSRRNLWLPILTHGIIDTLGFILIYFGIGMGK